MQHREHAGAHHGKQCHRFCEAVDSIAPGLVQQQQDSRNQRAGVADTDPPDKVDDRKTPTYRDVNAPYADALNDEPCGTCHQVLQDRERNQ